MKLIGGLAISDASDGNEVAWLIILIIGAISLCNLSTLPQLKAKHYLDMMESAKFPKGGFITDPLSRKSNH